MSGTRQAPSKSGPKVQRASGDHAAKAAAALKRAAAQDAPLVLMLSAAHPPADLRIVGKEGAALAEAGWRVTHLAPAPLRGARDVPQAMAGVEIATYPRSSGWLGRMRGARALAKRAIRLKPDVIHAHEPDSWYAAILAARQTGAAVVLDVHEHYPSRLDTRLPGLFRGLGRHAVRAACRWMAERADAVVVAKDGLEDAFPGTEVVPVRNYAAAVPVQPRAHRHGPVTLVHLGALTRERGAFEMLRALAKCPEGTRLSLIGRFTDSSETDFLSEARRLGLGGAVERHGWLPHEAAVKLAAEADIGLVLFQPGHENHRLALPHKLFDCMLAGLPVIVPSFAEEVAAVVRETGCGVLVDTADPETVAEAVRALSDPHLRAEMGAAGRAAALGRFGWAGEADRLVRLYQELAPLPASRLAGLEAGQPEPPLPAPPPPLLLDAGRAAAATPQQPPPAPALVPEPPATPLPEPALPALPALLQPFPATSPAASPVASLAPAAPPAPEPPRVLAAPAPPAPAQPAPAPAASNAAVPPQPVSRNAAEAFASLSAAMRGVASRPADPAPEASSAAPRLLLDAAPEAAGEVPAALSSFFARQDAAVPPPPATPGAAPAPRLLLDAGLSAGPAAPAGAPQLAAPPAPGLLPMAPPPGVMGEGAPRLLLDAALGDGQAMPAGLAALLARKEAEAAPGPPPVPASRDELPPPSQVLGPLPDEAALPRREPAASPPTPTLALGSMVQALRTGAPPGPRPAAPAEPVFALLAGMREAAGAPPPPPPPPRPAPKAPELAGPALTGQPIQLPPDADGPRLLNEAGLSGSKGLPSSVATLLARAPEEPPAPPELPPVTSDVPLVEAGLRLSVRRAPPDPVPPEWTLLQSGRATGTEGVAPPA
ncbi:glycosyltransferase family 4 protein [Roseomonas sp. SSH11]|uniref:Glycosyltransferase family 4 protein n=1 Tax=Pararoseomonas baculiformis TaxID=2820812 RepID=A0ABS4AI89_9PROT|nr:glycosyltransferase family 4 protein [Pararoseomonas baculiformis]MBP0446591.1 glycosyltransferase family 4 protein [Pararoseomonas baculiformis]